MAFKTAERLILDALAIPIGGGVPHHNLRKKPEVTVKIGVGGQGIPYLEFHLASEFD
jgi:hypothetical protein